MKRVKRNGVFETNSSMTHSVIIMTEENSKKWENEGLYYYEYDSFWDPFKKLSKDQQPESGQFYTEEEVLNYIRLISNEEYDEDAYTMQEFINEYADGCFKSFDGWVEDEYCEHDSNVYTTPGGETIVVYCKYGRDG